MFVQICFLISAHRVISSSVHSIFYGLVSPGEYYMLSLLRDSIINDFRRSVMLLTMQVYGAFIKASVLATQQ